MNTTEPGPDLPDSYLCIVAGWEERKERMVAKELVVPQRAGSQKVWWIAAPEPGARSHTRCCTLCYSWSWQLDMGQ